MTVEQPTDARPADVEAGRDALLREFRWQAGHADVWRVFRDATTFRLVVTGMLAPFRSSGVTAVAGIESRGFLLGGAAAIELGVGFIAIRKAGSLFPGVKLAHTTDSDYRDRRTELLAQRDSIRPGDRVLLVDDWAETGSQARAAQELIGRCGAEFLGAALMVDQLDEDVRAALTRVTALVRFAELPPDE